MIALYWSLLGLILYTYGGYFIMVSVLARLRPEETTASNYTPRLTIVVAAYNEELSIAAKLENILNLDYPKDALELIVGSDASDDGTDAIAQGYADRGVRLQRVEGRLGKTAVQNRCARAGTGDVLVFTDATTRLHKQSLRELVMYFADPAVGCVGARLRYLSNDTGPTGRGGRSYWGYEALLKKWESRFNSMIGVSGCYYAIRKDVYTDIDPKLISDFVVVLDTYAKGLRTVYAHNALCEEQTLQTSADEFGMRVRVALRTYAALFNRGHLLNPLRYPVFSFQLISHKILRYGVSFMLPALLVTNLFLLDRVFFQVSFAFQVGFYLCAGIAWLRERNAKPSGVLALPYYFTLTNLAAITAFLKFLRGERVVVWTPKR